MYKLKLHFEPHLLFIEFQIFLILSHELLSFHKNQTSVASATVTSLTNRLQSFLWSLQNSSFWNVELARSEKEMTE